MQMNRNAFCINSFSLSIVVNVLSVNNWFGSQFELIDHRVRPGGFLFSIHRVFFLVFTRPVRIGQKNHHQFSQYVNRNKCWQCPTDGQPMTMNLKYLI